MAGLWVVEAAHEARNTHKEDDPMPESNPVDEIELQATLRQANASGD